MILGSELSETFRPGTMENIGCNREPKYCTWHLWRIGQFRWFSILGCLECAQVLFCSFISASIRPPPSVQKRAVFIKLSGSLLSTWPIQFQRLLKMFVAMSSCWHLTRRSWFEMVLGQNSLKVLFRDFVWKVDNLRRSLSVMHSPALCSVQKDR